MPSAEELHGNRNSWALLCSRPRRGTAQLSRCVLGPETTQQNRSIRLSQQREEYQWHSENVNNTTKLEASGRQKKTESVPEQRLPLYWNAFWGRAEEMSKVSPTFWHVTRRPYLMNTPHCVGVHACMWMPTRLLTRLSRTLLTRLSPKKKHPSVLGWFLICMSVCLSLVCRCAL